jgi:branched-chain amino acid transport system permease protein
MSRNFMLSLVVFLALLAAAPLYTSNPYYIHMIGTIMIYAILLFGLDIVVGYTGQVSLGHAGLFGVGSYTAGVLFFKLGAPLWLIIPASIGVTAGFGALLAAGSFAVSVISIPMVVDRDVSVLEAVSVSLQAVRENPRAMVLWAGLIVVFTGLALVPFFLGLVVAMPLIGHASWHAYRDLVEVS